MDFVGGTQAGLISKFWRARLSPALYERAVPRAVVGRARAPRAADPRATEAPASAREVRGGRARVGEQLQVELDERRERLEAIERRDRVAREPQRVQRGLVRAR